MAPNDERKQHKCDLPCNQHITIFLWICGIFLTAMTILITNVVANDRRAVAEEQDIYRQIAIQKDNNNIEHAKMLAEASSLSREVLQRLARIETKIEAIK